MNRKRKAFTLTELLVVVLIIGVLSAVALPKFNQVIETRKTGEAEEIMSAIRTEQEKRCSLDQKYTMKFDKLGDIVVSNNTNNYAYSLQEQGMSAGSTGGDYTLKILSYQDGRICCDGLGCEKLNKNYADCSALVVANSSCISDDKEIPPTPTEPVPECTDGQVSGNQSCNGCGVQTTEQCVGGKWTNSLGGCSKTVAECAPAECTDGATSGSQVCNTCGVQTTQTCAGGKWMASLGVCSKEESECNEDCCSLPLGSTQAQECFKKKNGENSWAYKCSNYGNRQKCLAQLYQGGSQSTYRCFMGSEANLQNDKGGWTGCKACRTSGGGEAGAAARSFFSTGFMNYGCNSSVPQCEIEYEEIKELVWKASDWSSYMLRPGSCSKYDAIALTKAACGGTDACGGRAASSWAGQKSEYPAGTSCTAACYVGGKIYPPGTILNYNPDPITRSPSGPYQDVNCSGSGASQSCSSICIIPYTYKIIYTATK